MGNTNGRIDSEDQHVSAGYCDCEINQQPPLSEDCPAIPPRLQPSVYNVSNLSPSRSSSFSGDDSGNGSLTAVPNGYHQKLSPAVYTHNLARFTVQKKPEDPPQDLGYHTMMVKDPPTHQHYVVKTKLMPVHRHNHNHFRPEETELVCPEFAESGLTCWPLIPPPPSVVEPYSSTSSNCTISSSCAACERVECLEEEARRTQRLRASVVSSSSSTTAENASFQGPRVTPKKLSSSPTRKKKPSVFPLRFLPDNVLSKVLSYLPTAERCRASLVCKKWRAAAWDPSIWTKIELRGERVDVDSGLENIFRILSRQCENCCYTIEKVTLNGCTKLTDSGLTLIAENCSELRHLEVKSSPSVTNSGIFKIVTLCQNLEHLDMTGCHQLTCVEVPLSPPSSPDSENSEDSTVCTESFAERMVLTRHLMLQFVDLSDCLRLQDVGLKVIVRNCPQLSHLFLRRCVLITDSGVKAVASYCMTLRELSVSDCAQVTDFGLYELARLGANLRYLSVAKCDQISDAGIKQIAKHCYKLRYLNVRGCEAISDDGLVMLARSCPRLRALDIGKCDITDYGLRLLSENCPNLRKLSIKTCELVTDAGIQSIAYYCRGLQQLNVQECQITIEGYRTVKKYCKRCIIEHTNPGLY